jgi:DNA topoisomerase IB
MARVHRSDCTEAGIRRRGRGNGFSYSYPDGTAVSDGERERISALAIPPAWQEVWICRDPAGHIQATGWDAAGRKQYLYHESWRRRRERQKFDRVLDFASNLGTLRRRIRRDLRRRGLVEDRVLACAVRLLDVALLRIGSERYAAENETYGLATLRRRHLRLENGAVVLDYVAKGERREVHEIRDRLIVPTIRALKHRPDRSQQLFAYRDRPGHWTDVRSEQINAYLKVHAGEEFSAKDFRTWNATLLAAALLAAEGPNLSRTARERAIRSTVNRVAEHLGNTPAVCRSAYIDPRLFDRFRDGESIRKPCASRWARTACRGSAPSWRRRYVGCSPNPAKLTASPG